MWKKPALPDSWQPTRWTQPWSQCSHRPAKTPAAQMHLGDAHHCKTREKRTTISIDLNIQLFHGVLSLLCSISKIFYHLSHIANKSCPKSTIPGNLCFLLFVFFAEVLQVWSGFRKRFLLCRTCVCDVWVHTQLKFIASLDLWRPLKCVLKKKKELV